MNQIIIGKAALTTVRLEGGRRANVPAGVPVPGNAEEGDVERLLAEGFLEVVDLYEEPDTEEGDDEEPDGLVWHLYRSDTEEEPDAEDSGAGKAATIKEILAEVGDDPDKATAAMQAELGRGADARSTLIEALDKIAGGDTDAGGES